jgi:hypothetical protein
MSKQSHSISIRRDRRKAKQQEWTRMPSSRVGHHSNVPHEYVRGARLPCR